LFEYCVIISPGTSYAVETLSERLYHFATWNVSTLIDSADSDRPARRTALVAAELNRYNIDIAALTSRATKVALL